MTGEIADVRKEVKFTPSEFKKLQNIKAQTGVAIATQIKRAVQAQIAMPLEPNEPDAEESVTSRPLLGFIPAGPDHLVSPMAPGTTVTVPFGLPADAYALLVTGNSMEYDGPDSIPNGSYAFFSPGAYPPARAIVHVEFPQSSGEHTLTLKRYRPHVDGSVSFEPLNAEHEMIEKMDGEYVIRGVFLRAWDGKK